MHKHLLFKLVNRETGEALEVRLDSAASLDEWSGRIDVLKAACLDGLPGFVEEK